MPKCVTSLTANAAVEARPHCTNPGGWHFGSDCLRKDNRAGHDYTLGLGMTTPLNATSAAGVLPIRGVLKQHERPGIAM